MYFSPTVEGAGSCSNYRPQYHCSPRCDGSCSFYIFIPKLKTHVVNRIPWDLSVFIPGEDYCDLEAEGQLGSIMRRLPYRLGTQVIKRIPSRTSLTYSEVVRRTRSGPPCDYCTDNVAPGNKGDPDITIVDTTIVVSKSCSYSTPSSTASNPNPSSVCTGCTCGYKEYICEVKPGNIDVTGEIKNLCAGVKPSNCSIPLRIFSTDPVRDDIYDCSISIPGGSRNRYLPKTPDPQLCTNADDKYLRVEKSSRTIYRPCSC